MISFEEIKPIYDNIFKNIDGYSISLVEKKFREKNEEIFKDILYGQISIELLYAIYSLPPLNNLIQKCKIFYDLGSGIGNAVITSYLTGLFDKCVGIELMDTLYKNSEIAKERLIEYLPFAKEKVKFIHNNILNADFSEADLVLFCCPTKDELLRNKMENKFKILKNESIIISLIHKFSNEKNFELLNAKLVKADWGETPLFIYKKK